MLLLPDTSLVAVSATSISGQKRHESCRSFMVMPEESLQIDQDLAYQQREWLVERVGWIVMLLLIVAAAAGIFGNGVLSRASVSDGKQLRIEYERFAHYLTPTSLKVHMRTT